MSNYGVQQAAPRGHQARLAAAGWRRPAAEAKCQAIYSFIEALEHGRILV